MGKATIFNKQNSAYHKEFDFQFKPCVGDFVFGYEVVKVEFGMVCGSMEMIITIDSNSSVQDA